MPVDRGFPNDEVSIRVPLAVDLEHRKSFTDLLDFTNLTDAAIAAAVEAFTANDPYVRNGIIDAPSPERQYVVKRPGRRLWFDNPSGSLSSLPSGIHNHLGNPSATVTAPISAARGETDTLLVVNNGVLTINPRFSYYSGEVWTALPTAPWDASFGGFTNTLQLVKTPTGTVAIVSGRGGTRVVYRSTDNGTSWALQTAAPGWVAREGFSVSLYNTTNILLAGGKNAAGTLLRDVWRSTDDGATWVQQTAAAGWSARDRFALVSTDTGTRLFVVGGHNGATALNDVWRSADNGATWVQAATSEWSARHSLGAVILPPNVLDLGSTVDIAGLVIAGGISTAGDSLFDCWASLHVTAPSLSQSSVWARLSRAMPISARALSLTVPDPTPFLPSVKQHPVRLIASGGGTALAFAEQKSLQVWNSYTSTSSIVPQAGSFRTQLGNITRGSSIRTLFLIGLGPLYDQVFGSFNAEVFQAPNGPELLFGIGKVYFASLPLADRRYNNPFRADVALDNAGNPTTNPVLDGVFMNSISWAYFYNTHTKTLQQITSGNYPVAVVGGGVWFNGRIYVMTPEGRIHCSGINDPFSWSALDFINAIMSPDQGIGLVRQQTQLMALGRNSTEWFYDSGASPGSPLRRVDSAAQDFGCLHTASVVTIGTQTVFVGHHQSSGEVGVYALEGSSPQKISTPDVDRLLALPGKSTVRAFPLFCYGHRLYCLNVTGAGATLVGDIDSKKWYRWASSFSLPITSPVLTAATDAVTGLVEVTVTAASHFFTSPGQPLVVSGATQSSYNGDWAVNRVVSSSVATYLLTTTTVPATPATGPIVLINIILDPLGTGSWDVEDTATGPDRNPAASKLTNTYLLSTTTGDVYTLDPSAKTDNTDAVGETASFIDFGSRTPRLDLGHNNRKFISKVDVIGDGMADSCLIRYSDDDGRTWSNYRRVNMSSDRPRLHRQGSARRRVYEVRHPWAAAARQYRLEALEIFLKTGTS